MATLTTFTAGTTIASADVNANFSALNTETRAVGVGGTGAATLTDHGVLVGSGTAAVTALAVGTNGQLLVGSSSADPVMATLGTSNGLTTTAGAGTLSIAPVRVMSWMGGF